MRSILPRVAAGIRATISQLPTALVGGRLDTNIGAWLGSTAPTVGQKTMASSVPIVLASNQSTLAVQEQQIPQAEDNTNGVYAVHHKPLAVSTYAWSVAFTAALAASLQVKTSAGVIRKVSGRVDATAPTDDYFLQLVNANALPADGAVTILDAPNKIAHLTGQDSDINIDYTDNGIYFSNGCFLVLSTTDFATKTIAGAYLSLTALYR